MSPVCVDLSPPNSANVGAVVDLVVDSVSGPVGDPKFADPFADRRDVAGVAVAEPQQTHDHLLPSSCVPQAVEPFGELVGLPDVHASAARAVNFHHM